MIWLTGILLLILSLFILILFSQTTIGLFYKREEGNDRIKIEIGLLNGLIPLRREIPTLKLTSTGELKYKESLESGQNKLAEEKGRFTLDTLKQMNERITQIIDRVTFFNRITKRFLAKLTVVKMVWITNIGTGEAAETGMLSGLIWIVKGSVSAVVFNKLRVINAPYLWVEPSYVRPVFRTEFELIIKFRVISAVKTGLALLLNWRKSR